MRKFSLLLTWHFNTKWELYNHVNCVCLCDSLSHLNQLIVEPHLPTQSQQLYQSNSIKAAGVCFSLYWSILHKGTKGHSINDNICLRQCFLQTLSLSEACGSVNLAFDLRIYIQSRRVGHNWGRGLSSTNRWRVDVIDVEHPSPSPPHPIHLLSKAIAWLTVQHVPVVFMISPVSHLFRILALNSDAVILSSSIWK